MGEQRAGERAVVLRVAEGNRVGRQLEKLACCDFALRVPVGLDGRRRRRKQHVAREIRPDIPGVQVVGRNLDRKSTRLNSSHSQISYAVFCLKKKKRKEKIK